MTSPAWLAPDAPDLVWFTGPDTIRFLNDLISQEIGAMEPWTVRRSFLLEARGKLDHILWVLRGDGEVGLVTDSGRGEELATTMGRYRIRVDVEITEEEQAVWLVVGEHGGVGRGSWRRAGNELVADVSWPRARRVLVTGDHPGLEPGTVEDYERARIAAGEPRWGVDVDERTIPQESGLVDQSVDLDKGCFLGQELVARIDSRGRVNRHLRILELGAGTIRPGARIFFADKEVGSVTSVAGDLGMALVRREVSDGDTVTVDGASAVVRDAAG